RAARERVAARRLLRARALRVGAVGRADAARGRVPDGGRALRRRLHVVPHGRAGPEDLARPLARRAARETTEGAVSAALTGRGVVVRGEGGFCVGPVDLSLAAGEAVAVVGRAGAGKSLLLSGLVGLAPLAAGDVHVGGLPLDDAHLPALRRSLAFCFQRDALLDDETALENVAFALRARGLDGITRRAREALVAVG